MKSSRRRVGLAVTVLALLVAAPALAQENIDAGKTPAQLYAQNCAICHKTPHGLTKVGGMGALQSYLQEHYTASRQSAAAIAAYLISIDRKEPAPREHRRATRGPSKGEKPKAATAEKAKANEEKSKKSGEAKADGKPAKSVTDKAEQAKGKSEAKQEAKPDAKPAEAKAAPNHDSKPAPAEAKAAPKHDSKAKPVEAKAEPKTDGAKAPDAKPEKKAD